MITGQTPGPTGAMSRFAVDIGLPLVAFYGLRAVGVGIYPALIAGALGSATTAVVSLLRHRRPAGPAGYMTTMMLGGLLISLLSGSTRFLLAREALLTGVTGVWFLASTATGRPLAYLISRPLLEGRLRWPARWDELWARSPRFRRLWRVSSLLWGIGTLTDSALRVVMAYTLPPDEVPALGAALYGATSLALIVITNVYYALAGVYDGRSALYRPAGTPVHTSHAVQPGRAATEP